MVLQTSKKNMKKLRNLKQHVQRLCKDVLTPLSNVYKDIALPSVFEEDITIFVGYAMLSMSHLPL